jgi:hypothetical protein
MMTLAPPVEEVLGRGVLCYVAAPGSDGPHLTPVVFALDGGRLWVTTSRASRKARLWRDSPIAAGMVRSAGRAVSFRGEVVAYDLLDPSSWGRSAVRSPLLARASVRFSRKNLRFFAGYARDAHRVPLSWTPPGRVFLSLDLGSGALVDLSGHRPELTWGWRQRGVVGRRTFRPRPPSHGPEARVPGELLRRLGSAGDGALALEGPDGITVLPVRWARADAEGTHHCVLSRALLSLVGGGPALRASLVVDRASRWRAADMEGVQLRGWADLYLPDDLSSGRRSLLERAGSAGPLPPDPAVVRIRPERAVWWKGWSSGTVGRR